MRAAAGEAATGSGTEKERFLRDAERARRKWPTARWGQRYFRYARGTVFGIQVDAIQELGSAGRGLQDHRNAVVERLQLLTLTEKAEAARKNLEQAERTAGEIEEFKQQARERAAPDAGTVQKLEDNRTKAGQRGPTWKLPRSH